MRTILLAVAAVLAARGLALGDLNLASQGRSGYVVTVPADAWPAEKRGAEELQSYFRQMSGAELPIVTETDALPQKAIVLGRSRHLAGLGVKLEPSLGAEGFIIRTAGPHLVIAGPGVRGTMYGCDTFLEKLGVRWFAPRLTRVPKLASISIPGMDEVQTPAFEYREPFFTEAFDKDWAARNKANGDHAHLDASVGGRVIYHHFVHTFDDLIPPALYDSHPEYFPLIGGKRAKGYVQRCLSNPDVLKLTIEQVRKWIAERPDAMIYSVSQNDAGKWCQCADCTKIVNQYGGVQSGLYLWFVNQVAEAIEKEHPDKLIDTLAYQFTEAPPTGIVPRKNVRVRLCPIACCDAHPYEKCSAEPNRAFMKNLSGWAKITDTLYIWHYNTNFAHFLMPFPDFDEFPTSIRLYQKSGVRGIFFEGDYANGGGGSWSELQAYVMAKMLWDPKLDSDALVNEWMAGVYGPAAAPMRRWFDVLHEKVRDPNQHFYIFSAPTIGYLTPEVLAEGDRLFDEAEKLAARDATAARYVAKARLGVRYVKLMLNPTEGGRELDRFLADVRKFGIGFMSEGKTVDVWEKEMRKREGTTR